ncbi:MAG TPA: hypothetical protein VKR28_02500 [Candidatus Binatus sp.]|nr:hypothetical protein [Candidatus Binatus sp.]
MKRGISRGIGSEVFLEPSKIARIRFDRDDEGIRKPAQEVRGGVSDIRSAVDDQAGIAQVIQASIFAMEKNLVEYVEVARTRPDMNGMDQMLAEEDVASVRCQQLRPKHLLAVEQELRYAEISRRTGKLGSGPTRNG